MAMENQFRPDFDPGQVLFGPTSKNNQPYIGGGGSSPTLQAEAVRSTGTGPYDAAYRQNLATYAGGNFLRPGGSLLFNPTDPNALMGSPTGGGSAPVGGIPTSLVAQAWGGNPFSFTPPQPPQSPSTQPKNWMRNNWRFWLDNMSDNGNLFRGMMQ